MHLLEETNRVLGKLTEVKTKYYYIIVMELL